MRLPTSAGWLTTRGALATLFVQLNVLLVGFHVAKFVATEPVNSAGVFRFTSNHENTRSKATRSPDVKRKSVRWAAWLASRKL